jgi:putative transcriptional regulator
MSMEEPTAENLAGSLLVAHPNLRDPNFRRTILFLSEHSAETGALGLVLNRPLRKTFGEIAPEKAPGPLKEVELYYGGPVGDDHLTLASLQWQKNPSAVAFHSFMGTGVIDVAIDPRWQPGLRGFIGYSGWGCGQLENEIAQKAWIVLPPSREFIEMKDPESAWRNVMRNSGPMMKFLAEAPDDPELN